MSGRTLGIGYLFGLLGVVAAGAVVPILPTGAAVSAAAALADQHNLLVLLLVVVFGAAGSYLSDLATYAVIRYAGSRAAQGSGRISRWLHGQHSEKALDRAHAQLAAHELRTLVISRLVPGGQIPVLVAAALSGYRWRRYVLADIAPVLVWSAVYAATGIAGRAVFANQWEGLAAGISLVLLVTGVSSLVSRRRRPSAAAAP